MKHFKTFVAIVAAALTLGLAFSSCNENNDGPLSGTPAAMEIAGTFTGKGTVFVMNTERDYDNLTVAVTAENDETICIVIPAVAEGAMKLPEIPVKGLKVSGSNGIYSIAATEFNGTNKAGKSYSGTIAANYENKQLSLNVSLQYGTMPMPMVFKYSGTKK